MLQKTILLIAVCLQFNSWTQSVDNALVGFYIYETAQEGKSKKGEEKLIPDAIISLDAYGYSEKSTIVSDEMIYCEKYGGLFSSYKDSLILTFYVFKDNCKNGGNDPKVEFAQQVIEGYSIRRKGDAVDAIIFREDGVEKIYKKVGAPK
ncbi:hypothetical protein [Crocinitomix catalasitica]|uniref:hypothetical protein n=1 Tax=Crocinitomix catalasitica TaxID=184607 RepID=UPI0004876854|nr:hypothetical protein [Crocinitomix catalasitica]